MPAKDAAPRYMLILQAIKYGWKWMECTLYKKKMFELHYPHKPHQKPYENFNISNISKVT